MKARTAKRFVSAAFFTLLTVFIIFALMCILSDVDPSSYPYKSYLLQAQAWLRGETALDKNYEYLELAVYDGRYYVSFPPVPSVPMVLYTLIWGSDVPGGMFQKIYIAIACLVVLSEIQRSKRMQPYQAVAWAVLLCLGSAMLPICLVGGVWYEAQILAFLFSVSAIAAMRSHRFITACLCYALSVGCRPFSVLLGPVLLVMYLEDQHCANRHHRHYSLRQSFMRLVPGIAAGLCVAAAYAAYNYARFGNIFEFGHNYLPEFTRAEHGQLSLQYVGQNWKTLFFGSPVSVGENGLSFNEFGFSMFLSCPILIVNVIWLIQDLIRRRFSITKLTIAVMSAANLLLLLMHRTLGGHQFGARYVLELVPMCLVWYLISSDRQKPAWWEWALLAFGFIFNFVGGCLVHI